MDAVFQLAPSVPRTIPRRRRGGPQPTYQEGIGRLHVPGQAASVGPRLGGGLDEGGVDVVESGFLRIMRRVEEHEMRLDLEGI